MTTKNQLLKIVRQNCIECMGGQPSLVEGCTSPKCQYYEFRFGSDPYKNKNKVAQGRKNGFKAKQAT